MATDLTKNKSSNDVVVIPQYHIPGHDTGANKIGMDLGSAHAKFITNAKFLEPPPSAGSAVVITPGSTNLPVTVTPKEGFCSESTEYALSVIGVLCIVYGIVAK